MPRTVLEPRFQVEHLSILDSEGHLDAALEPTLEPGELRALWRAMLLGRRLDERMVRLQRQGRIGTFAPIKGQEASQIGSAATLRKTDWMVPSFRETAAMIMRGWPIEKLLLLFAGYLEGAEPAPDQHDLPITIPVATQLPHAVGLAYAAQYRGDDAVVMVFLGDGATSEGDFHEAMNFAGVWQVPVVFVCQNNQWAISVPLKKQTHSRTLAQKAHAYGVPRPLTELRPTLPTRLCRIIERMMAKKPIERYRSYEALIANLEYLARTLAAESRQADAAAARRSDSL